MLGEYCIEEWILHELEVHEKSHGDEVDEEQGAEDYFWEEESLGCNIHKGVGRDGMHIQQPEHEQGGDE